MLQGFTRACRTGLRAHAQLRHCSSSSSSSSSSKSNEPSNTSVKDEWRKRRNLIFDTEKERQHGDVGRVQKITVKFVPTSKEESEIEMAMNRNMSTPSDCAKHISEGIHESAALALVDGVAWDMHRPLVNDCRVRLLTMQMPKDSHALNPAFWRTCSFLLGAMVEASFKDDIQLYLHSFPRPNIRSGSFVCDVVLDLPDWKPTSSELRALSAQFVKLTNQSLPLERLEVNADLALDMFQDNPFKTKQIPEIAKMSDDNSVTLYRAGEHIDISRGPMVGNTSIIGRATVTAVHKIESDETDHMYRFQGVALPRGVYLNHFAYGILEDRAKKLNDQAWMPVNRPEEDEVIKQLEEGEEPGSFAAKN